MQALKRSVSDKSRLKTDTGHADARAEHAVDAERRLNQVRHSWSADSELERLGYVGCLSGRRRAIVVSVRSLAVETVSEVLPPAIVGQASTELGPPPRLSSAEDTAEHAPGKQIAPRARCSWIRRDREEVWASDAALLANDDGGGADDLETAIGKRGLDEAGGASDVDALSRETEGQPLGQKADRRLDERQRQAGKEVEDVGRA